METLSSETIDMIFGAFWAISILGYYAMDWIFFNVDIQTIQKILKNGKKH